MFSRSLYRRVIGLHSMMVRFSAGRRPQRIQFLRGQIRQMADEGDDFPDLFISVRGAEAGMDVIRMPCLTTQKSSPSGVSSPFSPSDGARGLIPLDNLAAATPGAPWHMTQFFR